MKNRITKYGVFVISVVLLTMMAITGTAVAESSPYLSDSFFVKYPSVSHGGTPLPGINTGLPAEILDDYSILVPGLMLVKVEDGMSVEEAIAYYTNLSGVESAEPNYLLSLTEVPNDPECAAKQWALCNPSATGGISAQAAWDISTGNDSIVVAVVDSGVDIDHPDLEAHIWNNTDEIPGNNIDDDHNGYIDDCHGWNVVNNNSDVKGYGAHGTHCAGIIGAVTNNSVGIAGTAWNVTIMPVKIFQYAGGASIATCVSGTLYAVLNHADIISMSFSSTIYSQTLKDIIDEAEKQGILCVCSAGNDGKDNDQNPKYPASFSSSNLITVAASNSSNMLASFSNRGATSVDIAAPGEDIYSTVPNVSTKVNRMWNFSDPEINVTGASWKRGNLTAYIHGANESLLYSTTPIAPLNSSLFAGMWYYVCNISSSTNAAVSFLISNVSFDTYANITDFHKNGKWLYSIDILNGKDTGSKMGYNETAFTKEMMNLGDGPYYIAIYYNSTVSTDFLNVLSVQLIYEYEFQGHTYEMMSGTSMSTPMVAGAAAVIKSVNRSLTPEEIKQIIIDTADTGIGDLAGKTVSNGRLNLSAAVLKARPVYTVIFNSNGGTDVASQSVYYKDTVSQPENPVKSGYTFSRWYGDANLSNEWNFTSDKVLGSTTLYANWTVNTTTVTPTVSYDDVGTATFSNTNMTSLRSASGIVSTVILDAVHEINATKAVTFTADNATLSIPDFNGYTKNEELAVFEIDANCSSNQTAQPYFLINVTFKDEDTANATKDKIKFSHYNTTRNAWDTVSLIYSLSQSRANVQYLVFTPSFSPFGMGIYTVASTPVTPSSGGSSSSHHSGSSLLLQPGQTTPTVDTPTAEPTAASTPVPTVSTPSEPAASATTQPTQESPVPFVGIVAGLGTAALVLRRIRR